MDKKNKKGIVDIITISLIIFFLCFGYIIIDSTIEYNTEKNFCKEKGYDRMQKDLDFNIYWCCKGEYDKNCEIVNNTELEVYVNG